MTEFISHSAGQTEEWGVSLAPLLPPGFVLALFGPLGSGKTVLARGILRGLGYDGTVPSPTYTIVHEYPALAGGIAVAHFDLYRVNNERDLESTGFYDYLSGGWTLILEWADRIPWAMEDDFLRLSIDRGEGEDVRIIRMDWWNPC